MTPGPVVVRSGDYNANSGCHTLDKPSLTACQICLPSTVSDRCSRWLAKQLGSEGESHLECRRVPWLLDHIA